MLKSNPMPFREKSPEELRLQLENVQRRLGDESVHPLSSEENIFTLSEDEIKERFTYRYDLYKKFLREAKRESVQRGYAPFLEDELEKMKKWLAALNNLDRYIAEHKFSTQERTLRPRQVDVFCDIRSFLERGGKKGYVKLPTGIGKTVIFSLLLDALRVRSLIAVPKNLLIEQTQERLGQFAPNLDMGEVGGGKNTLGTHGEVITHASLVRRLKDGRISPDSYDALILDEVHECLGTETRTVLSDERLKDMLTIGFTATDMYSEDKKVADLLPEQIHRLNITEAVELGLLSGFQVILAKTDVDLSKVRVMSSGEYDEKSLDKAINTAARNRAVVQTYQNYFMDRKAIAYCNSIAHAQKLADEFQKEGISAAAVWGDQNPDEQKQIFELYKSDDIKVLCSRKLLIAGFDDPEASVCLNATPTRSIVNAEQRGGRVLRLHKDKQYAVIVEFLDKYDIEKFPLTFAEIAGATIVPPKTSGKESPYKQEKNDKGEEVVPEIEGIEIVVDPEIVLEVIREHIKERNDAIAQRVQRAIVEPKERTIIQPPEGWISAKSLSIELGRNPHGYVKHMMKIVVDIIRENPTIFFSNRRDRWYEQCTDPVDGGMRIFLDPMLAEQVRAYIRRMDIKKSQPKLVPETHEERERRFVPIGSIDPYWNAHIIERVAQGLKKSFQRHYTAEKIVEIVRRRQRKVSVVRTADEIFAAAIRGELQKRKKVPAGAEAVRSLATRFGVEEPRLLAMVRMQASADGVHETSMVDSFYPKDHWDAEKFVLPAHIQWLEEEVKKRKAQGRL